MSKLIFNLQKEHLPFRKIKLKMGIKWYHRSCFLQLLQLERLMIFCSFIYPSAKAFEKEPNALPMKKIKNKKKYLISKNLFSKIKGDKI